LFFIVFTFIVKLSNQELNRTGFDFFKEIRILNPRKLTGIEKTVEKSFGVLRPIWCGYAA
jgi:hypothetical protein